MTVWRMRVACWIPKAKNTHSYCAILIAFPLQQWLNDSASVLHYMYSACLVNLTVSPIARPPWQIRSLVLHCACNVAT